MNQNVIPEPAPRAPANPFGPLVLMAVSLALVLGWNVAQAWQQLRAEKQAQNQQIGLLQQAATTERNLQAMLTDLVVLAHTDPQARAIVDKFQIKYTDSVPTTRRTP